MRLHPQHAITIPQSCPKHCSSVFRATPFFFYFLIFSIFLFFLIIKKKKSGPTTQIWSRKVPTSYIWPVPYKNRGQNFLLTGWAALRGSSMAWRGMRRGGAALKTQMRFNVSPQHPTLRPRFPPSLVPSFPRSLVPSFPRSLLFPSAGDSRRGSASAGEDLHQQERICISRRGE